MADKQELRLDPDPVIEAYKQHIDLTLIRESLKLTVTERMERLLEMQRLAEEMKRAGRVAKPAR
ncbi:MAG: hypothetical protein FJW20_01425 [Acidimicrobiia bacterium]|nr:hypothetical protein [Acidimicrobiia bacterium]